MTAYDTRSQYSPWAPASSVNKDHVCIALRRMLALVYRYLERVSVAHLVLYSRFQMVRQIPKLRKRGTRPVVVASAICASQNGGARAQMRRSVLAIWLRLETFRCVFQLVVAYLPYEQSQPQCQQTSISILERTGPCAVSSVRKQTHLHTP